MSGVPMLIHSKPAPFRAGVERAQMAVHDAFMCDTAEGDRCDMLTAGGRSLAQDCQRGRLVVMPARTALA